MASTVGLQVTNVSQPPPSDSVEDCELKRPWMVGSCWIQFFGVCWGDIFVQWKSLKFRYEVQLLECHQNLDESNQNQLQIWNSLGEERGLIPYTTPIYAFEWGRLRLPYSTSTALDRKDMYCNGNKMVEYFGFISSEAGKKLKKPWAPGPVERPWVLWRKYSKALRLSPPTLQDCVFLFHFLLNRRMFIMLAVCPYKIID